MSLSPSNPQPLRFSCTPALLSTLSLTQVQHITEQFTIGQHYWMQNPFFKDGTKLRVGDCF